MLELQSFLYIQIAHFIKESEEKKNETKIPFFPLYKVRDFLYCHL